MQYSIGICGIDFHREHPCNWMNNVDILAKASDQILENILCDDNDNRPHGITLERFYGYDTRYGGQWTMNWGNLTTSQRIDLMRQKLIDLSTVFDKFITDNWKNNLLIFPS